MTFDHTQAGIQSERGLYFKHEERSRGYAFAGVDDALMRLYVYATEGCTRAAMHDPDALKRKCSVPFSGGAGGPGRAVDDADRTIVAHLCLDAAARENDDLKRLTADRRAWLTMVAFGYVYKGKRGLTPDEATDLACEVFGGLYQQRELMASLYRIRRDMRDRLHERGMISGEAVRMDIGGFDLKTWGQIAAALETSVPTAQSWHAQLPMPIAKAGRVVVCRSEDLKTWYKTFVDYCTTPQESA